MHKLFTSTGIMGLGADSVLSRGTETSINSRNLLNIYAGYRHISVCSINNLDFISHTT
jgi:hypothetical protein